MGPIEAEYFGEVMAQAAETEKFKALTDQKARNQYIRGKLSAYAADLLQETESLIIPPGYVGHVESNNLPTAQLHRLNFRLTSLNRIANILPGQASKIREAHLLVRGAFLEKTQAEHKKIGLLTTNWMTEMQKLSQPSYADLAQGPFVATDKVEKTAANTAGSPVLNTSPADLSGHAPSGPSLALPPLSPAAGVLLQSQLHAAFGKYAHFTPTQFWTKYAQGPEIMRILPSGFVMDSLATVRFGWAMTQAAAETKKFEALTDPKARDQYIVESLSAYATLALHGVVSLLTMPPNHYSYVAPQNLKADQLTSLHVKLENLDFIAHLLPEHASKSKQAFLLFQEASAKKIPPAINSVILVGPPGAGKTTFADLAQASLVPAAKIAETSVEHEAPLSWMSAVGGFEQSKLDAPAAAQTSDPAHILILAQFWIQYARSPEIKRVLPPGFVMDSFASAHFGYAMAQTAAKAEEFKILTDPKARDQYIIDRLLAHINAVIQEVQSIQLLFNQSHIAPKDLPLGALNSLEHKLHHLNSIPYILPKHAVQIQQSFLLVREILAQKAAVEKPAAAVKAAPPDVAYPPQRPRPLDAAAKALLASKAILRHSEALPGRPEQATVRSGRYLPAQALIGRMKSQLPPSRYREFLRYYHSLFFFDTKEQLLENLASRDSSLRPFQGYDLNGERPLDGYLRARRRLFAKPALDLTVADLSVAHKDLLSKKSVRADRLPPGVSPANSENTPNSELGRLRGDRSVYVDPDLFPASALNRVDGRGPLKDSPKTYPELVKNNPLLSKIKDGVEYVSLPQWERFQERLSPATRARIQTLEARGVNLNSRDGEVGELRRQVLSELLERCLADLKKGLSEAKTSRDVERAVGEFYYEFISIHPYQNGNGRLARLLAERFLEEFGLPPPIWTHLGEDMALSREDFLVMMKDSLDLSETFHKELNTLVEAGIDYRALNRPYAILDGLIPEDFMTWVAAAKEPTLSWNAASRAQAIAQYLKWRESLSYKNGSGGMRLVTPLFRRTFAVLSSSPEVYNLKLGHFYDPAKTLYRGISLTSTLSDAEMIQAFAKLHWGTMGMGLDERISRAKMDTVFDQYNRELARDFGALGTRLKSHTRGTDENYARSGLTSFSTSPNIAKKFKNGYNTPSGHVQSIQARFEIQTAARKVGSYDVVAEGQPTLGEDEVQVLLGSDPESVTTVIVEDLNNPSPGAITSDADVRQLEVTRTRVAERVAWNRVRLREYAGKDNLIRETLYQISPSGRAYVVKPRLDGGKPLETK